MQFPVSPLKLALRRALRCSNRHVVDASPPVSPVQFLISHEGVLWGNSQRAHVGDERHGVQVDLSEVLGTRLPVLVGVCPLEGALKPQWCVHVHVHVDGVVQIKLHQANIPREGRGIPATCDGLSARRRMIPPRRTTVATELLSRRSARTCWHGAAQDLPRSGAWTGR